jgi:hypothetical protein
MATTTSLKQTTMSLSPRQMKKSKTKKKKEKEEKNQPGDDDDFADIDENDDNKHNSKRCKNPTDIVSGYGKDAGPKICRALWKHVLENSTRRNKMGCCCLAKNAKSEFLFLSKQGRTMIYLSKFISHAFPNGAEGVKVPDGEDIHCAVGSAFFKALGMTGGAFRLFHGSHRCHRYWCQNPKHQVFERGIINVGRNYCEKKKCPHTRLCMRDGCIVRKALARRRQRSE